LRQLDVVSWCPDPKEKMIEEAFNDLELLETIANNEWRTKIYRKQG